MKCKHVYLKNHILSNHYQLSNFSFQQIWRILKALKVEGTWTVDIGYDFYLFNIASFNNLGGMERIFWLPKIRNLTEDYMR